MFRRYLAIAPWKRRLLALAVGLAAGAVVTAAIILPRRAALSRFRDAYTAAQRAHDVARMAELFCWDGVPAEERGRLKLALKQESESELAGLRFEPLESGDGAPRDTISGRSVPNLVPVCRLAVTYRGEGAGYSVWLLGRTSEGYRIVVYRPESPATH